MLGLTAAYGKAGGRPRGSEAAEGNVVMTAASRPQVVTLRSGDVVRVRQVQPGDAPALARAYANLGEQSRYRRFFTVMPELPEATLTAAVEVDHTITRRWSPCRCCPRRSWGSAGSSAARTNPIPLIRG